jgi:hypothetical protein
MRSVTRRRNLERKALEYLIEGASQRWIIKHLKIGDRKLRKIFLQAKEFGYLDGVPVPPYPAAVFPDPEDLRSNKSSEADKELLLKKDWIVDRLGAGWRPITVFEECGLAVTRASFYRFLHRHAIVNIGRHSRRVVPEIVHAPGECMQLDWGKLRDVVDPETGKRRALWAFVGVMGHSRFMMVRLVWTNDVATTLEAISSMMAELGGVPVKITSDNPKCFALEASDFEPILNPAFERFAGHYGFTIECLPPRDPEKKGKVERMMSFVRRLYEAHGPEWSGLEESQEYLNKKLLIANERRHGSTQRKPIDDFLQAEVSFLKSLPAVAYQVEDFAEGHVRKDGHVRFKNKYYSLDEKFIGEDVFLIGSQTQVTIYHKGQLIELHERLTDPHRTKQTKSHHLKPWEQAMGEGSFYRKRALRLGPDVERMVMILLAQGQGFIDTRKIWGVLSLDKKYSGEAINRACRDAITLGEFGFRIVQSLLRLQVKEPAAPLAERAPLAAISSENKFVRSMQEYEEQLKLLH